MISNRSFIQSSWIHPFIGHKATCKETVKFRNQQVTCSFGLCDVGYDLRLGEATTVVAGYNVSAPSLERITMPMDHCGDIRQKSTNHRMGITVGGTGEPDWKGILTLELFYGPVIELDDEGRIVFEGPDRLHLPRGWGVCAYVFHQLQEPASYAGGKYDDARGVQGPL